MREITAATNAIPVMDALRSEGARAYPNPNGMQATPASRRARQNLLLSDRRRGTFELGEDRLLEFGAVLLARMIAVTRADELHSRRSVIAHFFHAHCHQGAGKRRALHLLLLDHRHPS